ncbi:MAG: AsmA family protein [Mariprofundus sp.]|nr:AsmA family protein [Mariprofundus sp.]
MSKGIVKIMRYAAGVVLLVVLLLLAVPFFVDVNSYKGEIEQTVEDATGRKLSIGKISASVFPWIGVELDSVMLANRKGFSDHKLLSVKKLHVKLALMPLFSKELKIERFEIIEPKIYLERHSDGENNWSDLILSKQASGPAAEASKNQVEAESSGGIALAALQAESLLLSGGELIWMDGKAKPIALTELSVGLNDVQLKRPVAINVSGKLDGSGFDLDSHVGPIGDLAQLDVMKLPLQGVLKVEQIRLQPYASMISGWPVELGPVEKAAVGLVLNLEQRPDGLRVSEGVFKLASAHQLELKWRVEMADVGMLTLPRLALAVDGKELIAMDGTLKELATAPTFKLHVKSQAIERQWLSSFVPALTEMYAAHPAPWKQVSLNGLFAGDSKHLDIRDCQLLLDQDVLKATGSVLFAGPDIRLRIQAKQLHLDPWLPQAKKEEAAASPVTTDDPTVKEAEVAVEPDLRFLKPWRVTTQIKIGMLSVRGLEMGNFVVAVDGSKGRFNLNPMRFKLAQGTVKEHATLNVARYPVRWTESVHMTGVQAGPLLHTLAGMDLLTGTMDMDTRIKATGLTEAGVKSLNGRGNVAFSDGALKGYDIAGAIRKFTNPGAASSGPQQTDFTKLTGSFNIINGVVKNRDLFMASPLLRVSGHGVINLVQKSLDYHVKPRVIGSLKGQGDHGMRRGISVPLHITGLFSAPVIRPEINAKSLLENAPALLDKAKVGGVLGGLLGKKGTNQGAAPVKQLLKGFGF